MINLKENLKVNLKENHISEIGRLQNGHVCRFLHCALKITLFNVFLSCDSALEEL